ncbi:MAG TPA: hypothetical protein VGG74_28450 [Kofleriaceae bacterium]
MKRLAMIAVLALAACGSGDHHNGPMADAYQPTGSGATCATLTGNITDFQPGIDNTVAGFPAPPSGLVLCGTDPMTNNPGASPETWFLAGNLSQSDVFTYYQTALTNAGYMVTGPVAEPGGNEKLVFATASGSGSGSSSSGSVVYNSTELFVLLLLSS